jgi:hypothetical protein
MFDSGVQVGHSGMLLRTYVPAWLQITLII